MTHTRSVDLQRVAPPWEFALQDGEVHVWRFSLDVPAHHARLLGDSLADDEAARADRFRREVDRTRFVVVHAQIRTLLAVYLDVRPEQLEFRHDRWGKPYLAPEVHGSDIAFNSTRSQEMGLCAVSLNRAVGVDVEHVRPLINYLDIAQCFFSHREIEALNAAPDSMRHRMFYTIWTRKEACVKALGKGLLMPIDKFDVTEDLTIKFDFTESRTWSLQDLELGESYVGSVVVEGEAPMLQVRDWH